MDVNRWVSFISIPAGIAGLGFVFWSALRDRRESQHKRFRLIQYPTLGRRNGLWLAFLVVTAIAVILAGGLGVAVGITPYVVGVGDVGDLLAGIGAVGAAILAGISIWISKRSIKASASTSDESPSDESSQHRSSGELIFLQNIAEELALGRLNAEKMEQLRALISTLDAAKKTTGSSESSIVFHGSEGYVNLGNGSVSKHLKGQGESDDRPSEPPAIESGSSPSSSVIPEEGSDESAK